MFKKKQNIFFFQENTISHAREADHSLPIFPDGYNNNSYKSQFIGFFIFSLFNIYTDGLLNVSQILRVTVVFVS